MCAVFGAVCSPAEDSLLWLDLAKPLSPVLPNRGIRLPLENDKITEAKSLVCDLRDNPAGEFFYDWVDKGTSVTVSFDGLGLQYHVNGDVVLGVAIGDFPVGFVCYEVRQLTGEEMLPPR